MSGRLRALLTLLLAVPVLLVSSAPAHACSCVMAGVSKHLRQSDAVFEGEVVEKRRAEHLQVLRVEVSRVYKGDVVEQVDVVTGSGGGDCGVTIAAGRPALFFASADKDGYGTSICAGTGTALHRDHPALADWHAPAPGTLESDAWDEAGGTSAWWWVGGFVAVGALGAAYVAWRRAT